MMNIRELHELADKTEALLEKSRDREARWATRAENLEKSVQVLRQKLAGVTKVTGDEARVFRRKITKLRDANTLTEQHAADVRRLAVENKELRGKLAASKEMAELYCKLWRNAQDVIDHIDEVLG